MNKQWQTTTGNYTKDIKLNKDKLRLKQKEVTFMGHVISAEGLKPDPTKIEDVLSMPTPTNKQDVRRLLGIVNYLQKFSPNLPDITAPLRELLQEDIMFQWNQQVHGTCFQALKALLTTGPLLKFLNRHKRSSHSVTHQRKDLVLACCSRDGPLQIH